MRFLETLGCRWNISLFHYRNHGADYGRVLCAFELPDEDVAAFHDYLHEIGYGWKEVSDDPPTGCFGQLGGLQARERPLASLFRALAGTSADTPAWSLSCRECRALHTLESQVI